MKAVLASLMLLAFCGALVASEPVAIKIRDLTNIEGVRENPLIGYGMVVGLTRTGDSQQTVFTTQTLANIMQRMGAQIPPLTARVANVAAVFVTASLPAFARPGTQLDVTVSSIGDAKSLEGGLLLLTPLYGADGQVYAAAQGPVAVGGYAVGGAGASKQMNHPTMGRVPSGGRVERSLAFDFNRLTPVSLLLREPDFSTADQISGAINREFGHAVASASDGGRVEVDAAATGVMNLTALLGKIENLTVSVQRRARVILNERTGTIVMGKDVRLGAVSILHGGFSVQISTEYSVSQPLPLSSGKTEIVAETDVKAKDSPAKRLEIGEGHRPTGERLAKHGCDRPRRDLHPASHQSGRRAGCRSGSDLILVVGRRSSVVSRWRLSLVVLFFA
jgi:flagellar P-ring protein precursor FlgI